MTIYLDTAKKLHNYLLATHWTGKALRGPDPIGKINWRITRFLRSYTRFMGWQGGTYIYLQGLAYWIKGNLALAELDPTEAKRYHAFAKQAADYTLGQQRDDGVWEHPPIRGRVGFISAVESIWATLALMAMHNKLGDPHYLDAAKRAEDGLTNGIGLTEKEGSLSLNYYSHTTYRVPNITTMYLWLLAELHRATGQASYLQNTEMLIRFLEQSLMDNGELQYVYIARPHFQAYQYNSFQFLDLVHYYHLTHDEQIKPILIKMAGFLATGVTERGSSRYDNFKENPESNYWTGALAHALREAHELGLGEYKHLSERGYQHLLNKQRADGGFGYSQYNYYALRDDNSYPRYQAMILHQLLYRAQFDTIKER